MATELPELPELPKQELLAKLLMMTTSSADNEALAAIRKANNLLSAAGWTWEMLIAAKIKVVENPFAGLGDPRAGKSNVRQEVNQPSPPPPPPRPKPQPQAYTWTPAQTPVNSRTLNSQPGYCFCCGLSVQAQAGWMFRPAHFNQRASQVEHLICDICNSTTNLYVSSICAAPQQPKPAARTNQYPGFCYCCGKQVPQLTGFIFKPFDVNKNARNAWSTICSGCNTPGAIIADHPAKHAKTYKPGLIDL